jgi:hypothetical protein
MPAYARLLSKALVAPSLVVTSFAAIGCSGSGQEVVVAPVVTGKEPGTTGQEPTGGGYESPGGNGGYESPGSGGAYEPPSGGSAGSGSGTASDGGLVIGSSSGGTIGSTSTDCPPCAAFSCDVTPSATTGPVTVGGLTQPDGSCLVASTSGFVVVLACGGSVLGATDGGTGTIGVWAANGSGGFTASGDGDVITCQ